MDLQDEVTANATENDLNTKESDENILDELAEDPASDRKVNRKKIARNQLTVKLAASLLVDGTLRRKVCRYCLNVTQFLHEMDQIMEIAIKDSMYKVTIKDMISSFHSVKSQKDPNIPNKICEDCLTQTLKSYMFKQQCDQAERAFINCFEDIHEKIDKLDPLKTNRKKKRGRKKIYLNHNTINTEHNYVMDYAEPVINFLNKGSELLDTGEKPYLQPFECFKCWEVLPNIQSLLNHEKTHPKTMLFNCRFCGSSFTKRSHLKNHINTKHISEDIEDSVNENDFRCKECGDFNKTYAEHLQHIEKHKFQRCLEHLVERKMDKLCSVCLDNGKEYVNLNKIISFHGGDQQLTGDKTVYTILGATIPEMNFLYNYTGNKVCEKCLNSAINTYIFMNHIHRVKNRLKTCIDYTMKNLINLETNGNNIFIEISKEIILSSVNNDYLENALLMANNEQIEEKNLDIEILEDEFRMPDSEHSDSDEKDSRKDSDEKQVIESPDPELNIEFNLARTVTKTYGKQRYYNGYKNKKVRFDSVDVCKEFLTFKKKNVKSNYRFKCQICSKKFVTLFHFRRHVLKHVSKKVKCPVCSDIYHSKFELREHYKMSHLLKRSNFMNCDVCSRSFVDDIKFKTHLKSHTNINCQLCDKIFSSQIKFNQHMERHRSKLNLFVENSNQTCCSFCEKQCSNDNQLSLHVNKSHLQIKPYGCDMCERQFYTEKNLRYHKKVHSLLCKESCEFCDEVFKCRKDLVTHVREHIGVKPWACKLCEEKFYSENKMYFHMNRYHGGRFICKICRDVFPYKSDLKTHVEVVHFSKSDSTSYFMNVFDN